MEAKDKKNENSGKYLIFSLIMLVVVAVLGVVLGVFDGFEEVFSMVNYSRDVIIKMILMIAFVTFLSNVLLLALKVFHTKKGRIATLSTVMTSIVKYAAVLVGFCWGLSIIGVNPGTIFASVGIVTLILGFGAESLVADLVTGVFVLFENQYNVGDIIEVDGFRGTVTEIGIRTVSLTGAGGNVKIINNSNLVNIINRSNQKSVAVCTVGVAYDTDLEALEEKFPEILQSIKDKHDVFTGDIKYLGVEELADSAMILKITAEVEEGDIFSARRTLNKEIKLAFDREGINIPFPQMDVHTK